MVVRTMPLTVADFVKLPQSAAGVRQELHHGEIFESPPGKMLHTRMQQNLVDLLGPLLRRAEQRVDKEFPFRALAEHDVRIADVAVFEIARRDETSDDDYYRGVPPLVIEVLSPSNTASEMLDREETCLRNGGIELWLVDPHRRTVKVLQASGAWQVFRGGAAVLSEVLSAPVAVSAIFAR